MLRSGSAAGVLSESQCDCSSSSLPGRHSLFRAALVAAGESFIGSSMGTDGETAMTGEILLAEQRGDTEGLLREGCVTRGEFLALWMLLLLVLLRPEKVAVEGPV